jgi:hypothetical protein
LRGRRLAKLLPTVRRDLTEYKAGPHVGTGEYGQSKDDADVRRTSRKDLNIMKTARIASAALFGTLSLGAMAPAFAQTATTATSTAATRQADHAARQDASAADLATRLGITKEKVLAAWSAQAALPRTARPAVAPTVAERKAAATASFAAYASSLGVSVSALTKALGDQQKANIDARVTDGSLTAAQAAARKAVVDADVAAGDVHGIGGKGGHGGPGGGHGGHGGH